jgi:hypothetical protein
MRYVWASLVAIGIIGFGVHFVRHTHEGVERMVREAAAKSGRPVPDPQTSNTAEIGLEVSGARMVRITLADLLSDFWYLSVMLVLLACFGTAALVGRKST